MPELPEVETLRRALNEHLAQRTIVGVRVINPKILKRPIEDPEDFSRELIGKSITSARRRGKHLIFGLSNGYALYAHLKMRGQMVVVRSVECEVAKYLCLAFDLDNGEQWRYHDMWTWGEFRLLPDDPMEMARYVSALRTMGPEPLEPGFNGSILSQSAVKHSGAKIKACLLDQDVLAGVGNIYADEALYSAKIRPERLVRELTETEWERLSQSIVSVLMEASEFGGTRSEDFVDADGNPGKYVPKVYDRGKEACLACGENLVRVKVSGRGTVFCPTCQI